MADPIWIKRGRPKKLRPAIVEILPVLCARGHAKGRGRCRQCINDRRKRNRKKRVDTQPNSL